MRRRAALGSTHGDVEDGDHVESRGEDGAHAFDRGLLQAVVGREHLPARDKRPNRDTLGVLLQKITFLFCQHHHHQPKIPTPNPPAASRSAPRFPADVRRAFIPPHGS